MYAVPMALSRKFSQIFSSAYPHGPFTRLRYFDRCLGVVSLSHKADSGMSFLYPLSGFICGRLISPCMLLALLRTKYPIFF